jgi:large subunit ribosomal protein L6
MSRVGKLPINIPQGVTVSLQDSIITVKGPKGTLARPVSKVLDYELDGSAVRVQRRDDSNEARALHGLLRALISNMVQGVSQGFSISLEIQGTGYRADAPGGVLNLSLGYSHPISFPLPTGIKATVEKNIIRLEGIDKELLGQTAAKVKALRPVEPYKGKGIRYVGEHVLRKAGKTGSKK